MGSDPFILEYVQQHGSPLHPDMLLNHQWILQTSTHLPQSFLGIVAETLGILPCVVARTSRLRITNVVAIWLLVDFLAG